MIQKNQIPKIVAATVTVLLVSVCVYLAMEISANNKMEESLRDERLKSETMLSEKLLLEKEIAKFKNEIGLLKGKNVDLDRILSETERKLDDRNKDINKLQKQNASLSHIKKQYADLLKLKDELESQLANHNGAYKQLQHQNEDLKQTIAQLEQQNQTLTMQVNSRLAAINEARVESRKRNDVLTVRARKTRKMLVNLHVPSWANRLSFRVIDPSGKELTDKDGTVAYQVVKENVSPQFIASLNGLPKLNTTYKEVEMVFVPTAKLTSGLYTIEVKDEKLHIGSLQVRFR